MSTDRKEGAERRQITTRRDAFDELLRRQAATAVVSFSGGDDEGGVDDIELFRTDGSSIGAVGEDWRDAHEMTDTQFAEDQLARALAEPVHAEFGGFDGAGVQGEVVWTVSDRSVVIRGSRESWEAFETTLEDA